MKRLNEIVKTTKDIISLSNPKNKQHQNIEKYMESLDNNTILAIQAIMYIGIRKNCESKETNALKIIEDEKQYLGFENKNIEISCITDKADFGNYLKQGLKILKL